jgi:hypothetical protein
VAADAITVVGVFITSHECAIVLGQIDCNHIAVGSLPE